MCKYSKFGECTCELPEDPDCDNCEYYEEADEFAGYVEWLRDEDAKLRGFEKA